MTSDLRQRASLISALQARGLPRDNPVSPFAGRFGDLPLKEVANIAYDHQWRGRNQFPSSEIEWKVADVVQDVLGPGYTVELYSGQEPAGAKPKGARNRHPKGFAGDFKIYDPQERKVTDEGKLKDVAVGMAARYNANIGYDHRHGAYMPRGNMHIDTMPLKNDPSPRGVFTRYGGGPQWGATALEWAEDLNNARANFSMPDRYYNFENVTAAPSPKLPQTNAPVAPTVLATSQPSHSLASEVVPSPVDIPNSALKPKTGQAAIDALLGPEAPVIDRTESSVVNAFDATSISPASPSITRVTPVTPSSISPVSQLVGPAAVYNANTPVPPVSAQHFAPVQPASVPGLSLGNPISPNLSPTAHLSPVAASAASIQDASQPSTLPSLGVPPVVPDSPISSIAPIDVPATTQVTVDNLPRIDEPVVGGVGLSRSKPDLAQASTRKSKVGKHVGRLGGAVLGGMFGGLPGALGGGFIGGHLGQRGLPQMGPFSFGPLISQNGFNNTATGQAVNAATANGGFDNYAFTKAYAAHGGSDDGRSYGRALAEEQRQRREAGQKTIGDAFGGLF